MTTTKRASTPARAKKRSYKGELRQKQAETTRTVILDAVERLVGDPETGAFTINDVASEAGVGAATVFRHFEGREALFDAFHERAAERFKLAPISSLDSLAEIPELVGPLFEFYEQNAGLVRAGMENPALAGLVARGRRRRAAQLQKLVTGHYSDLGPQDCREVTAMIQLLTSPMAWQRLIEAGASTDRAASSVAEAVRTLLTRFEKGPLVGQEDT